VKGGFSNVHRIGLAIVFLCLGGVGVAWLRASRPASPRFQPGEVPSEQRDLAVACLVLGKATPPVDELTDAELEAIVTIVARLTHAYERASFDSFLALRAADVEFAEEEHASDLEELRALCLELGVAAHEIPEGWVGALGTFWTAYYVRPPVARFVPEEARVELRSDEAPLRVGEDWERSFESLCNRIPGATIWHRLMIPHRNPIEEIAAAVGKLTWIDLDLRFESTGAPAGRLVTRFVWDGTTSEWFLERGATVYDDDVPSDGRHLVL